MPNVTVSGTVAIGGDLTVHRLGFGARRITGTGDPDHLAGNSVGADITLSAQEFEALDREGRAARGAG